MDLKDAINVSETSDHEVYTMRPLFQSDLKVLGIGASGQVYAVDEEIVLKSSRIYQRPGRKELKSDHRHFASDAIFHSGLLRNERYVLQLLQRWPHPHIMEVIDTDHAEGVYLRRYQPLPTGERAVQSTRIRWYREIAEALCHLQKLGIAHADVWIDNILLDSQGSAILCDFSAASPFGQVNFVFEDMPLPVSGPSPTLSEATDIFAMGSLIFEIEHGTRPNLSIYDGDLILPDINTSHKGIATIIRNAWLGNYIHTSEMLTSLQSLDTRSVQGLDDIYPSSISNALLKERVREWRESREIVRGCVLDNVLSEDQLQELGNRFGFSKDKDLIFNGHEVPFDIHHV
ncbi:hypothetical protein N7508_007076 [Penicillium antarcticum]|uniref:uncharacterized protein n=1 Tax=Penicillium antarcticum TaxID=416450 RepID=UPI002396735C|nr:uncharacterized protein N7508_007076 [Penicillium antarcticum]KAJ5302213.1 hypothetical protein N7508_007076 [Penicillium antarcticum]